MNARFAIGMLFVLASLPLMAQGSTTEKAERAKLTRLERQYTAAKSAYTKQPRNAELKKRYVAATVALGTATMNSPILAPKEKYPKALRLYREALKIDPKNKEARENHDVIVHIYKSMGRPVPK